MQCTYSAKLAVSFHSNCLKTWYAEIDTNLYNHVMKTATFRDKKSYTNS